MNIFGLSAKLFDVIIKTGLHISKCSFWRQFMEILISLLIFISAIYDYNFQLFRESFGGGVKTAFYMIREQFTAVCFFGEESLFCLFWTFTRKIWTSLWTSINNVAETICYVSKKKQTKQVCFCKLSFFMKIAEYELVKNGRLAELSRQVTQTCVLLVQKTILTENNALTNEFLPKQFRNLNVNLSAFPGIFSTWSTKLYSTTRTNRLKIVYRFKMSKQLNICNNWSENFQSNRENFRQGLNNCILRVQKNMLIKHDFLKKTVFQLFGSLSGKVWTEWGTSFCGIVETIFCLFRKTKTQKFNFVNYDFSTFS